MQNYTRDIAKYKIQSLLSLFAKGVFSSFIIPREKSKLTWQNKQTGPSTETTSRGRPEKCKFTTGENEQPRLDYETWKDQSKHLRQRALKKW